MNQFIIPIDLSPDYKSYYLKTELELVGKIIRLMLWHRKKLKELYFRF